MNGGLEGQNKASMVMSQWSIIKLLSLKGKQTFYPSHIWLSCGL